MGVVELAYKGWGIKHSKCPQHNVLWNNYLILEFHAFCFTCEGARVYSSEVFGQGSGPVVLNNVYCYTRHPNLTSCYIDSGDCPITGEDVGVRCDGKLQI